MDEVKSHIFSPSNFQDLFLALKAFPLAQFWAGGTQILFGQGKKLLNLEKTIITLNNIEDLKSITRTERYLELGSMVYLSRMLKLERILPPLLREVLSTISQPQIRNMATLGGNLAGESRYFDLASPLCALGAHIELRTKQGSRWIPASRFIQPGKKKNLKAGELITRVRIPLEPWDFYTYRKLGPPDWIREDSANFTFVARVQKETIEELRLVFCGKNCIRDRDLESTMAGKTLPLSQKEKNIWLEQWRELILQEESLLAQTRAHLFALISYSIDRISD